MLVAELLFAMHFFQVDVDFGDPDDFHDSAQMVLGSADVIGVEGDVDGGLMVGDEFLHGHDF